MRGAHKNPAPFFGLFPIGFQGLISAKMEGEVFSCWESMSRTFGSAKAG